MKKILEPLPYENEALYRAALAVEQQDEELNADLAIWDETTNDGDPAINAG